MRQSSNTEGSKSFTKGNEEKEEIGNNFKRRGANQLTKLIR